MPEILMPPKDLRAAAEEIRTYASTVSTNVSSVEEAVQIRMGSSKFSGMRADHLRNRFTTQQEYMIAFSNDLRKFADFLDAAAQRLQAKDEAGGKS